MPFVHEFGAFRLDATERLLLRDGTPVALTPKAFDLLLYLVERPGKLVGKQELMDVLWPDTFVEETNLSYTMSALRKALGDGQQGERYVQTVPTRGYRFVAPVTHEEADTSSGPVHVARRRHPVLAVVTAVPLLLALAAVLPLLSEGEDEVGDIEVPARVVVNLPDSPLAANWLHGSHISPDARYLAVVDRPTAEHGIWLKAMHESAGAYVPGTEYASGLGWAPDGRRLLFKTPLGALNVLHVADRRTVTICDICNVQFGVPSWSSRGVIVFAGTGGTLQAIAERGGRPVVVSRPERSLGEVAHRQPRFLPDGERFIYVNQYEDARNNALFVGRIDVAAVLSAASEAPDDGTSNLPEAILPVKVFLEKAAIGVYASGYMVYPRRRDLIARPFDAERLVFTGPPATLQPGESFTRHYFGGTLAGSLSANGVLAYGSVEHPQSRFIWTDRAGTHLRQVGPPGVYFTFDLSPNGRRLAAVRQDEPHAGLWVIDVERGSESALSVAETHWDSSPRWMSDNERVVVNRSPDVPVSIDLVVLGPGSETTLNELRGCVLDDLSRDGRFLLCRTGPEMMVVPLDGSAGPAEVQTTARGYRDQGELSPDSQWVAFNSNESGRMEVYVASRVRTGARWMVSADGGVQPRWRADGRELFYLGLDGILHAVDLSVRAGGRLDLSPPNALFETGLAVPSPQAEQYAVSNDGRQFLLLLPDANRIRRSVGLIYHWPALLRTVGTAP